MCMKVFYSGLITGIFLGVNCNPKGGHYANKGFGLEG